VVVGALVGAFLCFTHSGSVVRVFVGAGSCWILYDGYDLRTV
jgi:hypothetical protein